MAHGTNEDLVADLVIGPDAMADLFLRREEIPRYKQRSQTTRGGHAKQLRPLWSVGTTSKFHCICIEANAQLGSLAARKAQVATRAPKKRETISNWDHACIVSMVTTERVLDGSSWAQDRSELFPFRSAFLRTRSNCFSRLARSSSASFSRSTSSFRAPVTARIISSSFKWAALASRFCVF